MPSWSRYSIENSHDRSNILVGYVTKSRSISNGITFLVRRGVNLITSSSFSLCIRYGSSIIINFISTPLSHRMNC
ncbi:hypothetical protein BC01_067 [Bacillus phage BC01]|nr:hypothetical protein BC01_067 [Bacillus phage BC01]